MNLLSDELKKNIKDLGHNSVRIFHGRGKCFVGLENITIDWFDPYLLVDIYDNQKNLEEILLFLKKMFDKKVKGIICRNRMVKPIECSAFFGTVPNKHFAYWNDLKFEINFKKNLNIGYFLNSENIIQLVKNIIEQSPNIGNLKVLNLFAYTCSLSVIAKKFGASEITNIDMNKHALATGKINHLKNNLEARGISFLSYNIMKSFSGLRRKGPWDLIIIDPPSNQGKSFNIDRDYEKLLKNISTCCSKNCHLILTTNSPFKDHQFLTVLCSKYLPEFRLTNLYYSPDQFVEENRESGLKIGYFQKTINTSRRR